MRLCERKNTEKGMKKRKRQNEEKEGGGENEGYSTEVRSDWKKFTKGTKMSVMQEDRHGVLSVTEFRTPDH